MHILINLSIFRLLEPSCLQRCGWRRGGLISSCGKAPLCNRWLRSLAGDPKYKYLLVKLANGKTWLVMIIHFLCPSPQFESYDFITSEEITALLLPIHSIRILLIRRRARKELFREASSYKVGHKLPMKHAVPQKEDFCINQTEGLVESPSTLNLWVTSIDAVYDGCSCSIPKCLFHKRFFIARWLSDNCLHFPFLIKFDLFIETKDCCGLEDG